MRVPKRRLAVLTLAALAIACSGSSGDPPAGNVQIEPQGVDVGPGDEVKFAVFVGNTETTSVTWSVQEEGGGVVDQDGNYTAPAGEGTYHVVAAVGPGSTATAAVVVRQRPASSITVTIRPKAASAVVGTQIQFSASVSGAATDAVTWSIDEGAAGGTITDAGLYTAPSTAGTYHVVARCAADASQLERAAVTVVDAVVPPSGPQFYVSLAGSDSNPGTLAQPWRTIQKAMSSATPGSTVNIRGGTYNERLVLNVSGSSGSPITFQPYGFAGSSSCGGYTGNGCHGEQVVLDYSYLGTVTDHVPFLQISGKAHVVIQGIIFQNFISDGAMQQGIRVDGSSDDVKFRWVRLYNLQNVYPNGTDGTTALLAVRIWGPANDVEFSDCELDTVKTNIGEVLTYDYGSTNGLVERSYFHDTDGITLSTYNGANHFTFRDNRFAWCGVKRDGTSWYGRASAAIYNDGGHDGAIDGNVLTNGSVGIQSLAEIGGTGGGTTQQAVYNVVIRNNVIVHNDTGIVVGTWYSSTDGISVHDHDIYNNTIYGSNTGFLVRPFTAASTRVRNNAVVGCASAYFNGVGWNVGSSFDYNLYSGGGSGPDAHAIRADPMFANPAAGDFSLLPGSPAVDAGDPATTLDEAGTVDVLGSSRIVNGRVDVGAVERQ